jgi:hypothetical protein
MRRGYRLSSQARYGGSRRSQNLNFVHRSRTRPIRNLRFHRDRPAIEMAIVSDRPSTFECDGTTRLGSAHPLCLGEANRAAGNHRMTLSACFNTSGAIFKPILLAVLRLMAKSNLLACATARSFGCAPLRIFCTRSAHCRPIS